MIYCRSAIPSGPPIEIHGIVEGLPDGAVRALSEAMGAPISGKEELMMAGLPLELAPREAARSQKLAGNVPSFAGIEVANRPGICRIDPQMVPTYGRLLRDTAGTIRAVVIPRSAISRRSSTSVRSPVPTHPSMLACSRPGRIVVRAGTEECPARAEQKNDRQEDSMPSNLIP